MTLVRRATADDARAMAQISVQGWWHAYADILPVTLLDGLSADERAAGFQRMLDKPAAAWTAFVASAGNRGSAVGFAYCGAQRSSGIAALGFAGEFQAIYVQHTAQRRGLGRALMAAMAAALAGHDFQAAVWTLRDNEPARRFYEALGGSVIGDRDDRRPEHTYIEVAYGWRDLATLRQRAE